jgi:hypothetical protein
VLTWKSSFDQSDGCGTGVGQTVFLFFVFSKINKNSFFWIHFEKKIERL